MSKSLLGGGALAALFSSTLIFYAVPSTAEPLAQSDRNAYKQAATVNEPTPADSDTAAGVVKDGGDVASTKDLQMSPDSNPARTLADKQPGANGATAAATSQPFTATAYSLRGRTASGRSVSRGIIAADRRVLPLGTRVRVDAGSYSGEYVVADTGGAVRGRKIDIWMPSGGEALRFGRRRVKLTVLTHERNAPSRRAPRARR